MPICFDLPDAEVFVRITEVMNRFHPELRDAEVTIQVLFARVGEGETGPAVKAPGGWPAYAVIRRVPLKQRVAGFKDAEITIDEVMWNELSEPRKTALLDHELQHLELVYEGAEPGTPVAKDDWDRPKLKIRKHDWELSGFKVICERHPDAALEKIAAGEFNSKYGKVVFGAAEPALFDGAGR